MKRKKMWRYYCDFCGKSGCSGGHISKHEKFCTANPNRQCRMCDFNESNNDLVELKKLLIKEIAEIKDFEGFYVNDGNEKIIDKLRDAAEGCPACMLAAVRQVGYDHIGFSYQSEVRSFWNEINDREAEKDMMDGIYL